MISCNTFNDDFQMDFFLRKQSKERERTYTINDIFLPHKKRDITIINKECSLLLKVLSCVCIGQILPGHEIHTNCKVNSISCIMSMG